MYFDVLNNMIVNSCNSANGCEMNVNKIYLNIYKFLSHLYQDISLFLVFNMAPAAILDSHLEFESQYRPKIQLIR